MKPPVGLHEYSKTGKFPAELILSVEDIGREVAMPAPTGKHPQFKVHKDGNKGPDALPAYVLNLYTGQLGEFSNPNYSIWGNAFTPKDGDIIPIYGELYLVEYGSNHLALKRVTDSVPVEIRPSKNSRTISTAEKEPTLFFSGSGTRSEFYQLKFIGFGSDKEIETADIELLPFVNDTVNSGPPKIKKMNVTVFEGQPLSANGSSLAVAKVVPPRRIEGVGNLLGWIEFKHVDRQE